MVSFYYIICSTVFPVLVSLLTHVFDLLQTQDFLNWAKTKHYQLIFVFLLQFLLQYLFYPLSFLLGVEGTDCLFVGKLLGIRTFSLAVVAYPHLGPVIKVRLASNLKRLCFCLSIIIIEYVKV